MVIVWHIANDTLESCRWQLREVTSHLFAVGPILVQREAYIDLWCSWQIGDVYIDLSIDLFDTYTSCKVNGAQPLNPILTPHNDHTQIRPYTPPGQYHVRMSNQ